MNVSALMETFIDRFSHIFHCPRFFHKKALFLSTTGALGLKEILDYLHLVAGIWGLEVSHMAGIVTLPMPISGKKEIENEQKLKKERGSPGLGSVIVFRAQRKSFISKDKAEAQK